MPKLTQSFEDGGAGLTEDEAFQITQHEWDNYRRNVAIIKKHQLQDKVDLWEGKATTVFENKEQVEKYLGLWKKWDKLRESKGLEDWSGNVWYLDEEEARKVSWKVFISLKPGQKRTHHFAQRRPNRAW
jgi:hypothetical protein